MGSLPPHLLEFDDAIYHQYRGNYTTFLSLHLVKSNMIYNILKFFSFLLRFYMYSTDFTINLSLALMLHFPWELSPSTHHTITLYFFLYTMVMKYRSLVNEYTKQNLDSPVVAMTSKPTKP